MSLFTAALAFKFRSGCVLNLGLFWFHSLWSFLLHQRKCADPNKHSTLSKLFFYVLPATDRHHVSKPARPRGFQFRKHWWRRFQFWTDATTTPTTAAANRRNVWWVWYATRPTATATIGIRRLRTNSGKPFATVALWFSRFAVPITRDHNSVSIWTASCDSSPGIWWIWPTRTVSSIAVWWGVNVRNARGTRHRSLWLIFRGSPCRATSIVGILIWTDSARSTCTYERFFIWSNCDFATCRSARAFLRRFWWWSNLGFHSTSSCEHWISVVWSCGCPCPCRHFSTTGVWFFRASGCGASS